MLSFVGCGTQTLAVSDATDAARLGTEEFKIDAGIVFEGRPGYFCIALEMVGIAREEQPVSVDSSCDGVQPHLVKYIVADGSLQDAVLLEYSSNSGDQYLVSSPKCLFVNVKVQLQSGRFRHFTAKLLSTSLVRHQPETEAGKA